MATVPGRRNSIIPPAQSRGVTGYFRNRTSHMKNTIYKDLIPLYKMGTEYLIALRIDIPTGKRFIDDCLVLQTNKNGTFSDKPWSLQKLMKFNGAYYNPIPIKSWTETKRKFFKDFKIETINKIEQLLLDPPQESVKSLIYIPPRLLDKSDPSYP